ncbi:nitrilase-related carbon-nitrogen hydrolase [Microbaculum sp. FT89]|uniref:nitrilase-related carbon-nitrogen hydrolase n=1 Tax=Microbaculum sp. FT89 TaxID=3447298 RepID=UPI003F52DD55
MSTRASLTLALAQSTATSPSEADDLRRIGDLAARGGEGGANLLLLPELEWGGYGDPARSRARALHRDALVARLAPIARASGIDLVIGYGEAADDVIYNSMLWLAADGTAVTNYRKLHLWGDYEKAVFRPGVERPEIVERHGLHVGLLICFDLDQPQAAQDLARRGVDLILAGSATSQPYSVVPHAQVPARAYENGIFLAFCNRADAVDGAVFLGESTLAAPDGQVLVRAAERADDLVFARVAPDDFAAYRAEHGYGGALRCDIYHAP